ncbi:MAG: M48 family metalloprotease [Rhodospirillales bacterium]|nr:M48 family metalloprotease [Rhodospirillales bacterium]
MRVGREEHPKILRQFGGAYEDERVRQYVDSIGQRLANTSELPDLKFTFTVLNSDIVNAFALPGGYVYITRGLLALASSEAELAGVLGHEIGHITSRHTAERYSAAVATGIGTTILGVVTGSSIASQLGQNVAGLALASYSRGQESEADQLGVAYLARTGYDPQAVAAFLAKLEADSRLSAEMAGKPGSADQFNIMQTHPRTAERVEGAIVEAQKRGLPVAAQPRTGHDEYLAAIDGLYFGGDPENGFVRNRVFIHPALRLQFEAPPGFHIFNGERSVTAIGPNTARIRFDSDARNGDYRGDMASYLQNVWARGARLSSPEAITINGLEAATAGTRIEAEDGPKDIRLVAIRFDGKTIYRFLFATPPNLTAEYSTPFRRTTYSFRRLSDAEAATLKPLRLRLVTVGSGDTPQSLARRMAFDDLQQRRFEVLNGIKPGDALKPGEKVKIVSDR